MKSYSSSTFQVSTEVMETITWARTSSGQITGAIVVDVLLPDAACGDGRIHDVLAVQRENDAPAGLPDRVTGAAETLDGGGHA